jgi:AhpD family alkylhydroperoxidase
VEGIVIATDARVEYTGFTQTAPGVAAALTAVGKAVSDSGLDKALIELIKIRALQINGCAFCVQYHLNAARKANLSQTKLDLVAVWARRWRLQCARERGTRVD